MAAIVYTGYLWFSYNASNGQDWRCTHYQAVMSGIPSHTQACNAALWPWKQAVLNLIGSALEHSVPCTASRYGSSRCQSRLYGEAFYCLL